MPSIDDGLDYLLSQLMAIYLAKFANQWTGLEPANIRAVWKSDQWLGKWLTHKETLDWVLQNLDPKFPPTLIELRALCVQCPHKPPLPKHQFIEKQKTQSQLDEEALMAQQARDAIWAFGRNKTL